MKTPELLFRLLIAATILLPAASLPLDGQCALHGSTTCESAPLICQSIFCDTLGIEPPDGPHNGWCGNNTAIHNPRYYAFVVAEDTIRITIASEACTGGQNALQAAILAGCPWTNADVLDCIPGVSEGDSSELVAVGPSIGDTCWLVVDGSAQSVCAYTVTATAGISFATSIDPPDTIMIETQDVCAGFEGLDIEVEAIPGVQGYWWSASWDPADSSHTVAPRVTMNVPDTVPPGDYLICVRPYSACDTADLAACLPVYVHAAPPLQTKDTVRLCADAFPFAWHDIVIDMPGTYTARAYTADSCARDSVWTILEQEPLPAISLYAEAGPCVTDSSFVALVDVSLPSEELPVFDLLAGTAWLGQYSADDFPLLIDDFPGNGSGQYSVSVCRPGSASPDCCTSYAFNGPACPGGTCQFSAPELMKTPCTPAQTVDFLLTFGHMHAGAAGFSIVSDGTLFGPFVYDDLPVRFGPFAGNGSAYPILLLDNEDPACNLAFMSPPVECATSLSDPERGGQATVLNNGRSPVVRATTAIRVTIHSSDGRIVVATIRLEEGGELSLVGLPQGLYLARIQGEQGAQTITLVKTQ